MVRGGGRRVGRSGRSPSAATTTPPWSARHVLRRDINMAAGGAGGGLNGDAGRPRGGDTSVPNAGARWCIARNRGWTPPAVRPKSNVRPQQRHAILDGDCLVAAAG